MTDPAGDVAPCTRCATASTSCQFAELSLPIDATAPSPCGRRDPRRLLAVPSHDLSLGRPAGGHAAARRGWAAWNIEYRRVGNGGGVPDDARRRRRGASTRSPPSMRRSTGPAWSPSATRPGATWRRGRRHAPSRPSPSTGVGRQAGVLDLRRAAADVLGSGATEAFLGGEPADVPERYAEVESHRAPARSASRSSCVHGRRRRPCVPIEPERALRRCRRRRPATTPSWSAVDGDHFVVHRPGQRRLVRRADMARSRSAASSTSASARGGDASRPASRERTRSRRAPDGRTKMAADDDGLEPGAARRVRQAVLAGAAGVRAPASASGTPCTRRPTRCSPRCTSPRTPRPGC